MLEGLDKVDWSRLKHAYGPATDVPGQIRALASRIGEVRSQANYALYGNIFHQGTRYEATPYAVPFLFELLTSPDVADKHEIITLLVSLAIGYDETWLPDGIDPAGLRRQYREFESNLSEDERAENERYGVRASVVVDCYDAVLSQADVLVRLTLSDDVEVRKAAVYALAWFPEIASESAPRLREVVEQTVDLVERATALMSLGLLRRHAPECVEREYLAEYGGADSPPVGRQAAAIAVADEPLDPWVSEVLLELLRLPEDDLGEATRVRFNESRIQGLASQLLSKYGRSDRTRVVDGLCEALKVVDAYESMDVVTAMLQVIVDPEGRPLTEIGIEDFNDDQKRVFHAIADHGGWSSMGGFANFDLMMREYGLPASQAAMYRFLGRHVDAGTCEVRFRARSIEPAKPWWKFW
jgi:hypothetical protein